MARISAKTHGIIDYATGAAMLAAPRVLGIRDRRAAAVLWAAGITLASLPAARTRGRCLRSWAPHAVFGIGEIALAALTERRATRAGTPVTPPPDHAPDPPSPDSAARGPGLERPAWADVLLSEPGDLRESDPDDTLVAQEESAAAAQAAMIGGGAPAEAGDPAMDPVYQAGGGEQDGWEAAEAELIENATHGDGHADPLRDAISPEVESDLSGAVYGESDGSPSTEVVEDPDAGSEW